MFCKCPVCGDFYHILVRDPDWYEKMWPEGTPGELVPGTCIICFSELEKGCRVKIRKSICSDSASFLGKEGTVLDILTRSDGTLYKVEMSESVDDGQPKTVYFVRAELEKLKK